MSTTTTTVQATVMSTPAGPFAAVVDGPVLLASGFTTVDDLTARLGLVEPPPVIEEVADLGIVGEALQAYFDGTDVTAIDGLEVRQPGGAFRQAVWTAMRQIPAGTTMSYGELAVAAGFPSAVRAVGTSCAVNLLPIVVPCHRVTRSGGALGNYYYGLPTKRWLIDHEAEALSPERVGQLTLAP